MSKVDPVHLLENEHHFLGSENTQTIAASVEKGPPDSKQILIHAGSEESSDLSGIIEDVDKRPTTTRKELWAYYLYYNGDPR
jgi:uncharacterized Zn finger protein